MITNRLLDLAIKKLGIPVKYPVIFLFIVLETLGILVTGQENERLTFLVHSLDDFTQDLDYL